MNIINRNLTIVQNPANKTAKCTAGCTVTLDAFETASLLIPGFPGFRLSCVLLGIDPGPDDTLFIYPRSKKFTNILDITGVNQVFEDDLSFSILNEDANGADEIRAEFTLINLSTGQSRVRRSNQVQMNF